MLKSMTGYGKIVKNTDKYNLSVELKSLNSKGIELQLKVPSSIKSKEIELRTLLAKHIIRGKAELIICFDMTKKELPMQIDKDLVGCYINQLSDIASINGLNMDKEQVLSIVMDIPGVMMETSNEPDLEIYDEIKESILLAIQELNKFRIEEGVVLEKEIGFYIDNILNLLTGVEKYEKKRIDDIKEKICNNAKSLMENVQVSEDKLMQELFFYIEKLDITEEKVRLKKHCDYFLDTMKEDEAGKKLGFIAQEIGREVNTLGAKANNTEIQKIVVQMKDELEKIKEQLLNIL